VRFGGLGFFFSFLAFLGGSRFFSLAGLAGFPALCSFELIASQFLAGQDCFLFNRWYHICPDFFPYAASDFLVLLRELQCLFLVCASLILFLDAFR